MRRTLFIVALLIICSASSIASTPAPPAWLVPYIVKGALSYSAYSAHRDRRFRPNVTEHSAGSALGRFLTLFGHVASTFRSFSGFFELRLRGNP
jgi:hypothetical protein